VRPIAVRQEADMRSLDILAALALPAVALLGLPGCSFCPGGLAPTAADTAAGLSCHFTPEQEKLRLQREDAWRHPAPASW
jgi:hypothetical protein